MGKIVKNTVFEERSLEVGRKKTEPNF